MTDLIDFGFKKDNTIILRCKKCGEIITKVNGAVLAGTPVKYGVCRKYSHGASIVKA